MLAFLRAETGSDPPRYGLFVVPARGGSPRRLTGIGVFGSPGIAWSPDGRRIAYEANAPRDSIFLIGVNGRGKVALTDGELPAWSPDGRRLAFRRAKPAALPTSSS